MEIRLISANKAQYGLYFRPDQNGAFYGLFRNGAGFGTTNPGSIWAYFVRVDRNSPDLVCRDYPDYAPPGRGDVSR